MHSLRESVTSNSQTVLLKTLNMFLQNATQKRLELKERWMEQLILDGEREKVELKGGSLILRGLDGRWGFSLPLLMGE